LEGLRRLEGAITQNPQQAVGTIVPSLALRAQVADSIAKQTQTIPNIQAALKNSSGRPLVQSSFETLQISTAKTAGMLVKEILEPQWDNATLSVAKTCRSLLATSRGNL
jgi:S-adenosylmethionine synthetase